LEGFWTVLIGRTDFDTTTSIPDFTLSLNLSHVVDAIPSDFKYELSLQPKLQNPYYQRLFGEMKSLLKDTSRDLSM
jgi:hypothetical protein